MLLRTGLQVVDLAQLRSDVPVSLLTSQLVLIVVTRMILITALSLDLQHVGNVYLMRLQALDLVSSWLFYILVRCVFKNDAI